MDFINYEQDMIARFNGLHPTEILGQSNANNFYQKRYLLNKIYSKFNIDFGPGLEDFDLNTFRFILFNFGTLGIFKKDNYIYYSLYGVEKWNIYRNPARVRSQLLFDDVTAELQLYNQEVNKDCIIIKAFDDYRGFYDLLNDYSETLATFDKAIKQALLNGNIPLMAYAKDKKQAEEIRTAYALATQGTPLVILDKELDPETKDLLQPISNHDTTGIIDKLLTSRRMVVNNFLTEIGINNANLNKKERLVTNEVEANDEEVISVINNVYLNIKEGFEKTNEIFGTNMSITLNKYDEVTNEGQDQVEGGEE